MYKFLSKTITGRCLTCHWLKTNGFYDTTHKKMFNPLLIVSLLIIFFTGCKQDSSVLLAGRWTFSAMDMPGLQKFLYEIHEDGDNPSTTMKKFLLDNKLILRTDSTFDLVLMKQYLHGHWQYDQDRRNINLLDESARKLNVQFHLDTVNNHNLKIDTDEFTIAKIASGHMTDPFTGNGLLHKAYYQFILEEDKDRYSDLSSDPYAKPNNWWRIKPFNRETDEQIRQRILNHLLFWQLIFTDARERERPYVSYGWFSSPIVVASNGVIMKLYDDVKKEWDENFYDSVDAHKGFELMRQCFSKKIRYMETDDKYRRNEDIIKQLKENFIGSTGSEKGD